MCDPSILNAFFQVQKVNCQSLLHNDRRAAMIKMKTKTLT